MTLLLNSVMNGIAVKTEIVHPIIYLTIAYSSFLPHNLSTAVIIRAPTFVLLMRTPALKYRVILKAM